MLVSRSPIPIPVPVPRFSHILSKATVQSREVAKIEFLVLSLEKPGFIRLARISRKQCSSFLIQRRARIVLKIFTVEPRLRGPPHEDDFSQSFPQLFYSSFFPMPLLISKITDTVNDQTFRILKVFFLYSFASLK